MYRPLSSNPGKRAISFHLRLGKQQLGALGNRMLGAKTQKSRSTSECRTWSRQELGAMGRVTERGGAGAVTVQRARTRHKPLPVTRHASRSLPFIQSHPHANSMELISLSPPKEAQRGKVKGTLNV